MEFGNITLKAGRDDDGILVAVEVNEDAMFTATFQGEDYAADTLAGLRRQLKTALLASRVEVPFVSVTGRSGVLRGYHSGNRDLLVTWSDGEKDRMSNYERVFRTLTDEQLAELRSLREQAEAAQKRLIEITNAAETASELFNEAFGADVTDHAFRPEVALT